MNFNPRLERGKETLVRTNEAYSKLTNIATGKLAGPTTVISTKSLLKGNIVRREAWTVQLRGLA